MDGRSGLRPCFVNFRTTDDDVRALVDVAVELGSRSSRNPTGRARTAATLGRCPSRCHPRSTALHVELRLQALLDAIPDLMFRISADGTYLDFAGDAELLANPREDVVGGTVDTLLPPDVATA